MIFEFGVKFSYSMQKLVIVAWHGEEMGKKKQFASYRTSPRGPGLGHQPQVSAISTCTTMMTSSIPPTAQIPHIAFLKEPISLAFLYIAVRQH